jgi:hypothetical protein
VSLDADDQTRKHQNAFKRGESFCIIVNFYAFAAKSQNRVGNQYKKFVPDVLGATEWDAGLERQSCRVEGERCDG